MWTTCGPDGGTPRGILLGFSTRRLSCLVCIRLLEPRLLLQPRAVRLDKNNSEERGTGRGSWALQGHTVGRGPESLLTHISHSWLCSEARPAPGRLPL